MMLWTKTPRKMMMLVILPKGYDIMLFLEEAVEVAYYSKFFFPLPYPSLNFVISLISDLVM
jgi:hypothetical protein